MLTADPGCSGGWTRRSTVTGPAAGSGHLGTGTPGAIPGKGREADDASVSAASRRA